MFVMVMVTPGMAAPLSSVIVPDTPAVVWADAGRAHIKEKTMAKVRVRRRFMTAINHPFRFSGEQPDMNVICGKEQCAAAGLRSIRTVEASRHGLQY